MQLSDLRRPPITSQFRSNQNPMHRSGLPLALVVLLTGLLLPAPDLHAQEKSPNAAKSSAGTDSGLYTWVDEQGNYHMVDSIGAVPKKYRSGAKARASQGAMAGEGGNYNVVKGDGNLTVSRPAPAAAPAPAPAASAGDASKLSQPKPLTPQDRGYWTARINAARTLKAQSEAELETIDPELYRLRTLTPPGFHQSMADLESRRTELQTILQATDVELNETIPSDARKAGVSSSWLN